MMIGAYAQWWNGDWLFAYSERFCLSMQLRDSLKCVNQLIEQYGWSGESFATGLCWNKKSDKFKKNLFAYFY